MPNAVNCIVHKPPNEPSTLFYSLAAQLCTNHLPGIFSSTQTAYPSSATLPLLAQCWIPPSGHGNTHCSPRHLLVCHLHFSFNLNKMATTNTAQAQPWSSCTLQPPSLQQCKWRMMILCHTNSSGGHEGHENQHSEQQGQQGAYFLLSFVFHSYISLITHWNHNGNHDCNHHHHENNDHPYENNMTATTDCSHKQ